VDQLRLHPGLLRREWEGEFVIFHAVTGETHLFSGFAARVFAALERGPLGEADLQAMAREAGVSDEDAATTVEHLNDLRVVVAGRG
jgi:PqqD family protein of HPr-rel-A system